MYTRTYGPVADDDPRPMLYAIWQWVRWPLDYVATGTGTTDGFDVERNGWLLGALAARPEVERMFVAPEVKRVFCARRALPP